MLLLDAFRVHALYDPGNTAICDNLGRSYTYRQIWNTSELLGAHLLEQGERGALPAGATVGVVGTAEPLIVSCILAAAKTGHPHTLLGSGRQAFAKTQDYAVVLAASSQLAADLKLAQGLAQGQDAVAAETMAAATRTRYTTQTPHSPQPPAKVFDAELMLSYIVPGMTDDFSCGCGTADCSHGPFLQECMPSEWLKSNATFCMQTDGTTLTASEHDTLLTKALTKADDEADTDATKKATGTTPTLSIDIQEQPQLTLCNTNLAAALAKGQQVNLT